MSNSAQERAEEYRTHADRIREQIPGHKDARHRQQLEEIARRWERMAEAEEKKFSPRTRKP